MEKLISSGKMRRSLRRTSNLEALETTSGCPDVRTFSQVTREKSQARGHLRQSFEAERERATERAATALAIFETEARNARIAYASHPTADFAASAAVSIGCAARLCDLAIVLQPEAERQDNTILREILFQAGGPVLFIPHIFRGAFKAKRIGICWDGSRLAARASEMPVPSLPRRIRCLRFRSAAPTARPRGFRGQAGQASGACRLAGQGHRASGGARRYSAFHPVGGSRRESRNAGDGSLWTFAPAGRDPGRRDQRDAGHHDGTDADVSLRHNFQYARISSEVINRTDANVLKQLVEQDVRWRRKHYPHAPESLGVHL